MRTYIISVLLLFVSFWVNGQAQDLKITAEYISDNKVSGLLSFDKLKEYYQKCDIGVIASLQEQASYAAIEMAMFGLPIITTAVDGLDEMFEDNVNALKVNTSFSKANGLTVDVPMLADKIINLLNDKDKRLSLGRNARTLYENKWSLEKMIHSTVLIYKQINT